MCHRVRPRLYSDLKKAGKALGDNEDFINSTLEACLNNDIETYRDKEVPDRIQKAFGQMGITVKINMKQTVLPGGRRGRYKKFADTTVEPFSRWFFQDRHGKAGVLFRVKDIMKARYGAKFFNGYAGDLQGAWWHVSSSESLEDIYELMS